MKFLVTLTAFLVVFWSGVLYAQTKPTCPIITKTLKEGMTHTEVPLLRVFLIQQKVHAPVKKQSKRFDAALKAALAEWQLKNGVKTTAQTIGTTDAKTRAALRCKKAPSKVSQRSCLFYEKIVPSSTQNLYAGGGSVCSGRKVKCIDGVLIQTDEYESESTCAAVKRSDNLGLDTAGSFFALDFVPEHSLEHSVFGAGNFFSESDDGRFFFKILFMPEFVWTGYRAVPIHYGYSRERNSAGIDSNGSRSFTREQFELPHGIKNLESFFWSQNAEWLTLSYASLRGDLFSYEKDCNQQKAFGCMYVRPDNLLWVKNWKLPDTHRAKPVKLGIWNATPQERPVQYLRDEEYPYNGERFIGEAWYYPQWSRGALVRYIDTVTNTHPSVRPSKEMRSRIRDDALEALIVRMYSRCGKLDTHTPEKDCRVFADYVYGKNAQQQPIGLIAVLQGVTPHPDNWPEQASQKKPGYWGLYATSLDVVMQAR